MSAAAVPKESRESVLLSDDMYTSFFFLVIFLDLGPRFSLIAGADGLSFSTRFA